MVYRSPAFIPPAKPRLLPVRRVVTSGHRRATCSSTSSWADCPGRRCPRRGRRHPPTPTKRVDARERAVRAPVAEHRGPPRRLRWRSSSPARQLDRPGPRSCGASGDRGGFPKVTGTASACHTDVHGPGHVGCVQSASRPWESACVTSRRRAVEGRCAAGAVDAGPPLLPHRPDRSRVLVGRAPELRGRAHALAAPPTGVVPVPRAAGARADGRGRQHLGAPAARVLRGRAGKRAHPRPTAAPAEGPFPGGARRAHEGETGLTGDVASATPASSPPASWPAPG